MKKRKFERSQVITLIGIAERYLRVEAYIQGRQCGKSLAIRAVLKMEHHKRRLEQWLAAEERINAKSRGSAKAEWDEVHHLQRCGEEPRVAIHGSCIASTP